MPANAPLHLRPLSPLNLRANDGAFRDTYVAGGDVALAWSYRVKNGRGRAAGEQLAGTVVGEGVPSRDGRFRVRIYAADGTTLKRSAWVDDDAAVWTYTNVDLLADFATVEPASFVVEVVNVDGSYESVARRITVTKRS